jgi:hypothetical protein
MKGVGLFLRTHKTLIISIFFLVVFSVTVSHATPPSSSYGAGATLDPQCAPGSANCSVQTSPWTFSGNDIFYTTGKVGIGTSTPGSALDVSGSINANGLTVTGVSNAISAPTNLQGTIVYGSGGYTANANVINYRVYAYKIIGGTPTYSSTYATLSVDLTDNNSGNPYTVHLTWNAVAGVDGYKIIFGHGTSDSNYQTGSYTTATNSLVDDGCGTVCFSGSLTVTPVATYSNTNTINGVVTNVGGNLFVSGNITCSGVCGAPSLWDSVTGGINYAGGKVGIGTTTPSKSLSVNGDIIGNDIYFNNIASTNHYIFGANSNEKLQIPGTGGDTPWIVNNENGQGLSIADSGTQTHSFTYQTNLSKINLLGIQSLALDNSSQSNTFIRIGNTATTYTNNKGLSILLSAGQGGNTGAQNGGDIKIDAGAAGATGNIGNILLSSITAGNVGVGAGTPTSLLSVNGSFNATGDTIILGNGTGTNPHVDIIARGDQDGLRLYSLQNLNGTGLVNPPSIGFYRSIGTPTSNALPRFKIVGRPADNADSDGFLLSSPASSINWLGGSVDGRDSGLGQPATAINFYQLSLFSNGIVVGSDTDAASPAIGGVLRSGRKPSNTGSNDDVDGGNFTLAAGGGTGGDLVGGNIFFQTPDAQAVNSGLVQPMTTKVTLLRNGDFGIANTSPTFLLDVGSSAILTGTAVAEFQNAGGTCDVTPSTTGGITCSSDMNLKKNISNLFDGSTWSFNNNISIANTSILNKILALNPVDYNWNVEQNTDPKHAGFIAQEVQQVFPDLVTANPTTHLLSLDYTGLVPYTIEAIKEMNVNITDIADLTKQNSWRDALLAWLGSATNGIKNIFSAQVTTPSLCVGTNDDKTCITKAQLDQLLQQQSASTNSASSQPVPPSAPADTQTQTPDAAPITVDTGSQQSPQAN